MAGPPTSSQPPIGESRVGNVYHKAERVPRSRHEEVHKVDAAGETVQQMRDPSRAVTIQNIRRFVIFTIGIGMVLYFSVKVIPRVSKWMQEEEVRPPRLDDKAAKELPTPTDAPDRFVKETKDPGAVTPEMETITKAVFLQKRAESLAKRGAYEEAIARYRDALEVWPYLTQVWSELGTLYLKIRDYQKAQTALERAVQHNPGSPEILNDLAVCAIYLGQIDKAGRLLDTAIEISKDYPPPHFNMALCHMARNDRKAGRASLERYLRLKGNDPRALRELAYLDASEKRYPEAMEALEKAIIEKPDWAELYFDAASCSALMAQAEEAVKYLDQALPLSNPAAVYRLYNEPAFNQVRLSEIGIEFEKQIAQRAKQALEKNAPVTPPTPTQPIISSEAG